MKRIRQTNEISSRVFYIGSICAMSYYIHNPYYPTKKRKLFRRGYGYYFRISKDKWLGFNSHKRLNYKTMYVFVMIKYLLLMFTSFLLSITNNTFQFISNTIERFSDKINDIYCDCYSIKNRWFIRNFNDLDN